MRRTIVTIVAAGAVGATGFALAGPALAEGTAATSSTVTAQVDRIREALSGLVKDETITASQADSVAKTLQSAGIGRGPHGHDGRGGPGGPGGRGERGHGGRLDLATAASTLTLTQAQLRTALEGGKTLAQIAADQKVPVTTLISALVKAEQGRIAAAVKDGRITQAQADERLADVTTRVTDRVNRTRPARGDRPAPSAGTTAPTPPTTPTSSTTTS